MNKKELIVLVILLIAITTRFIFIQYDQSALPGFTAVGAMMILAAAYMTGWKKWIVPLGIFWVSDMIVNNVVYAQYYDTFQVVGNLWVYGAYAVVVLIAYVIMRKPSVLRLVVTSSLAAVVFFLVTNFGAWLHPAAPYAKGLSGLMSSYEAGIPFFRNGLMGDVFFSLVLFGAFDLVASRISSLDPVVFFRKSLA